MGFFGVRPAVVGLALLVAGSAFARDQGSDAPPCSDPAYRQLDFWVGEWDASWGEDQKGTNTITRTLDGCAIEERFSGSPSSPLNGFSISTYRPSQKIWRQLWVDNQGGFLPFTGGPDGDTFVLNLLRTNDSVPYMRMVFEDIKDDSFVWRWQRSQDQGESWEDRWVINYTRRD